MDLAGHALGKSLDEWLGAVRTADFPAADKVACAYESQPHDIKQLPIADCRAIIGPHAGFSYSGSAAAYAYKCIDSSAPVRRVFLLGPSHHYYLSKCALSKCKSYETPLGNLELDSDVIESLRSTGKFEQMTLSQDEEEHSIEMHLPYVRKIYDHRKGNDDIKIVPILVGNTSDSTQADYAQVLAPYLADSENVFIISSDFCHWGRRFDYTAYHPQQSGDEGGVFLPLHQTRSKSERTGPKDGGMAIWESIRDLDNDGIAAISHPVSRRIHTSAAGRNGTRVTKVSGDVAGPSEEIGATLKQKTASEAVKAFDEYMSVTGNTVCGCKPIGILLHSLAVLEGQGRKTQVRFTRYEQSSQCLDLKDSSVSYASAFVTVH